MYILIILCTVHPQVHFSVTFSLFFGDLYVHVGITSKIILDSNYGFLFFYNRWSSLRVAVPSPPRWNGGEAASVSPWEGTAIRRLSMTKAGAFCELRTLPVLGLSTQLFLEMAAHYKNANASVLQWTVKLLLGMLGYVKSKFPIKFKMHILIWHSDMCFSPASSLSHTTGQQQ